jgi:hypothetical protein
VDRFLELAAGYSAAFQSPLIAFALTSLIIEMTPGPNMAYLAILGASRGRIAGFSAILGVALGLALCRRSLSRCGLAIRERRPVGHSALPLHQLCRE